MGAYARYGMAKLANLAFSYELARREPTILSNAVHPGVVASTMLRRSNFHGMLGSVMGEVAFAAAQLRNYLFAYGCNTAALTVLRCAVAGATGSEGESKSESSSSSSRGSGDGHVRSGGFYVPVATRWEPHHGKARDQQFGEALWTFANELVTSKLKLA